MESIPSQINYKPITATANNKYRYMRLPMNNLTSSSFAVAPSTTQLMEYKLPTSVYNLAQSFIGYQLTVDATALNSNWLFEDTIDLASNVYFGNVSGVDIVNVNNVNRYVKVARKMRTKFSDFMSNDSTSQLYPTNTVAGNGAPAAANPIGFGTSTTGYLESKYLSTSGVNTAVTRTRLFPLSGFKETFLAMDKDVYFNQEMYLRLTAGPGTQMSFRSLAANDPTSTPTAATQNITVSNAYLWLAVETNEHIINAVMSTVLSPSGLTMNIPYTTSFRNSNSGAGVVNVQIPITQQYGRKLKRILHTVWDASETANLALDCSNTNGSKVASYRTYLDSKPLQDDTLSCATFTNALINIDDWIQNQRFTDNSAILNRPVYQLNWFHCDSFYHEQPITSALEDNHDDGLVMDSSKLWTFTSTTAAALSHYTFATFTRRINISREGVNYV